MEHKLIQDLVLNPKILKPRKFQKIILVLIKQANNLKQLNNKILKRQVKIKIWMCCMLQNSFHTSICNKGRLGLIEGINMSQTYQWSICSSNSIEANPSFRV